MRLKTKFYVFLMSTNFVFTGFACKMPWDSNDDSTPRESSNEIKIKQIEYYQTSGSVSPNYYYTETYRISSSGLTFERTGLSTGLINIGNWMVNYGAKEEKLFSDLSNPDVYNLKAIGQEVNDCVGGGIQSYIIAYENGEVREVLTGCRMYTIKYNNSNSVTVPIDDYIASDILPPEASNRYK